MRPDPRKQLARDEPGRVIYLGDVRRRRKSGRQRSPTRHYLVGIGGLAVLSWGLWLVVLFTLPPARLLTFIAFFAPLWAAQATTVTAILYAWLERFSPPADLSICVRRGALAASSICFNLGFVGAHRWSPAVGALSLFAVIGLDVLLEKRSRLR